MNFRVIALLKVMATMVCACVLVDGRAKNTSKYYSRSNVTHFVASDNDANHARISIARENVRVVANINAIAIYSAVTRITCDRSRGSLSSRKQSVFANGSKVRGAGVCTN